MGEQQKNTTAHKIFFYLRIGFVTAAIIAVGIWVCGKEDGVRRYVILGQSFVKMGPWFFAGIVGAFVVSQAILASRWWLLLRTQGIHINIWAAIRLHFLGLFYNNAMPGSVGGDLIRAWYVTKHTDKKFAAVLSIFVDRFIGLLSSLMMAGFCYFVLLRGVNLGAGQKAASGILKWGLIAVVILVCLVAVVPAGRKLLAKAYQHGVTFAEKFWTAAVLYGSKPLTLLAAFGLTFILQSMVITGFWLIGRQIGIEASVKYYFVFFPLTWGLGAIPVSVGGAGIVEGGLAVLFVEIAHVEKVPALAIALCQRAVWIVAALPGAWIHWTGRHLPKDAQIEPGEN
jgi:glycosyltransferase 2 family protein